jgi:hypothetical protein
MSHMLCRLLVLRLHLRLRRHMLTTKVQQLSQARSLLQQLSYFGSFLSPR